MEEKVILNLETYNNLIKDVNFYVNRLEKEKETVQIWKETYNGLATFCDKLEDYIIENLFSKHYFTDGYYDLEDILNIKKYPFDDKYKIAFSLGINYKTIKKYVTNRYNELNKKEEAEENGK